MSFTEKILPIKARRKLHNYFNMPENYLVIPETYSSSLPRLLRFRISLVSSSMKIFESPAGFFKLFLHAKNFWSGFDGLQEKNVKKPLEITHLNFKMQLSRCIYLKRDGKLHILWEKNTYVHEKTMQMEAVNDWLSAKQIQNWKSSINLPLNQADFYCTSQLSNTLK